MQKAIVPHTSKALGQYMLKHQPKELFAGDFACPNFPRLTIQKPERDMRTVITNDILLAHYTAIQVA